MLLDAKARGLRNLRLSVTDRCNLRCHYCMPEKEYKWLDRKSLLTFEELSELVDVFISFGVKKVRLTGGEPLLRRNLDEFIQMLALKQLDDLAMTTNGMFLPEHSQKLKDAGLKRITVSLDTLQAGRFERLTGQDSLNKVLAGIDSAQQAGFEEIKLNCVLMNGFNEDEILDFVEFARARAIQLRFIEYMDVGGATHWQAEKVFALSDVLRVLGRAYGEVSETSSDPSAPARVFRLPSGQKVGVIASVSAPFCGACDRARITADGMFLTCLYSDQGFSLREVLRNGTQEKVVKKLINKIWSGRNDAGAEDRQALAQERQAIFSLQELRQNVHREMHLRGG